MELLEKKIRIELSAVDLINVLRVITEQFLQF
jgi:hypothetical protein